MPFAGGGGGGGSGGRGDSPGGGSDGGEGDEPFWKGPGFQALVAAFIMTILYQYKQHLDATAASTPAPAPAAQKK